MGAIALKGRSTEVKRAEIVGNRRNGQGKHLGTCSRDPARTKSESRRDINLLGFHSRHPFVGMVAIIALLEALDAGLRSSSTLSAVENPAAF